MYITNFKMADGRHLKHRKIAISQTCLTDEHEIMHNDTY